MSRRAAELLATLVCLVIGGFFVRESLNLGIGQLSEPGPGMLPAFAAGLMVVLSAANFVTILRRSDDGSAVDLDRTAALKLLGTIAAVAAMAFAMPHIGFFAASGAMLFFLFYVIASLPVVRAAIMTVVTTSINYAVFAALLKVPFP
jgi:putative tricarboxylic transport membrane protein